jgi:Dioxygenase
MTDIPTRRTIIAGGALAATSLLGLKRGFAQGPFAATPECHDGDHVTLREMEGPFFKPASPERTELLEAGMAGRPMQLVGFVLSRHCKPLSGVLLDFWQADDNGAYDNSGFRLRGHQFSDATLSIAKHCSRHLRRSYAACACEGAAARWPPTHDAALFSRRTQEPLRRSFRSELAMRTAESNGSLAGRFDFVLDVA